MAPIRYSLHYEDYSEHLMSRFGKMLQSQSLVDMTLMCNSHTLRVHKVVLAASSVYFQEVLQKQSGDPLIILKMRFSVLKSLVEFMYCGKTQCLEENLDELMSAAQFLKIKGLSKVTKEGLGITDSGELPPFTPPVVISRPYQANGDAPYQQPSDQHSTELLVSNPEAMKTKDMRNPFDIDKDIGSTSSMVDYLDTPKAIKPRRGRPSSGIKRNSGWEGNNLGRAAERAMMRREQDSRKAIHHLKHLQSKQMQEYMERMTLSQAVSTICGPDSSSHNYMNMDKDFMYMNETVTLDVLDNASYPKEQSKTTNNFPASTTTSDTMSNVGSTMTQYVNALKNAGLPTDLPILFESGDGSYINVNEQVLLDMVQSSEIQYEVIEQPNIIQNVSNPNEIKSIDDLSKSIERGELLLTSGFSNDEYSKDMSEFSRHEEAINSLNAILPDNLESFSDQPNFTVMDSLQGTSGGIDQDSANDFSCIDGDMQFFTKSMSDDVKKYYESQQLEQLCSSSNALDNNFTMSLLNTKNSRLSNPVNNHEQLERNDDTYDFGINISHNTPFKEDTLNCLISTPKRTSTNENNCTENPQDRADLFKDLININTNLKLTDQSVSKLQSLENNEKINKTSIDDFRIIPINENDVNFHDKSFKSNLENSVVSPSITSDIDWDINLINKENEQPDNIDVTEIMDKDIVNIQQKSNATKIKSESWDEIDVIVDTSNDDTIVEDVPFAVGLLPIKQSELFPGEGSAKRKSLDMDIFDSADAKCLKRKAKFKKCI